MKKIVIFLDFKLKYTKFNITFNYIFKVQLLFSKDFSILYKKKSFIK